jgi:hypothetical protein
MVSDFAPCFTDPRSEFEVIYGGVFEFFTPDYWQSRAALGDLHRLAQLAGYRGLVFLMDEFENALIGLNNVLFQQKALLNLQELLAAEYFKGHTFIAVTPDYSEECRLLMIRKLRFDFDLDFLDDIATFRMSPLEGRHVEALAKHIALAHSCAYGWPRNGGDVLAKVQLVMRRAMAVDVQDRVRRAITSAVQVLDAHLYEAMDG